MTLLGFNCGNPIECQKKVLKLLPQVCNLIKRDSVTGVFLWILRNFQEHLFYRTLPVVASPNCCYLHCAIVKALHSFQEKRALKSIKGYAIFSSKFLKWDFQDFQNVWKQDEIHQSSLLN